MDEVPRGELVLPRDGREDEAACDPAGLGIDLRELALLALERGLRRERTLRVGLTQHGDEEDDASDRQRRDAREEQEAAAELVAEPLQAGLVAWSLGSRAGAHATRLDGAPAGSVSTPLSPCEAG